MALRSLTRVIVVGLVVVHIAGSNDQNSVCCPQPAAITSASASPNPRSTSKSRVPRAIGTIFNFGCCTCRKGKLNFDGVFAAMRRAVLLQCRKALAATGCSVSTSAATSPKRSLPGGVSHQSPADVPCRCGWGRESRSAREFLYANTRPRNGAGVDVPGMRSDASDGGDAGTVDPRCSAGAVYFRTSRSNSSARPG